MDAYAGEVQSMHPFYAFDSPARALDMDLATTNAVCCTFPLHLRPRPALTALVRSPRQPHRWHSARLMDYAHSEGQGAQPQLPQLQLATCARGPALHDRRHQARRELDQAYVHLVV